ncbi:cadherin repeat domain-containing protein, partial [Chloroflexota bacterium]
MKANWKRAGILVGTFILCITVFFASTTPTLAAKGGKSGTSLEVWKTAEAQYISTYTWEIEKTAAKDYWELVVGDEATSQYTITATKVGFENEIAVTGMIYVTNCGDVPTENLTVVDQVQYKLRSGKYQDGASIVLTVPEELQPGETGCYPYEVRFNPIVGAKYRNVAKVTITNHGGHPGEPFGPEPKTSFVAPAWPTVLVNDTVTVEDSNSDLIWVLNDSAIVSYETIFSADNAGEWYIDNTVSIIGTYSGELDADSARVTFIVSDPNQPPIIDDQSFNVEENSVTGTVVGTVAAVDPDPGDILTYAITGGDTGAFVIDSNTGLITVADSSQLDYETTPSFTLTVEVEDTELLTDTAAINIYINPVNSPPVANSDVLTVPEDMAIT